MSDEPEQPTPRDPWAPPADDATPADRRPPALEKTPAPGAPAAAADAAGVPSGFSAPSGAEPARPWMAPLPPPPPLPGQGGAPGPGAPGAPGAYPSYPGYPSYGYTGYPGNPGYPPHQGYPAYPSYPGAPYGPGWPMMPLPPSRDGMGFAGMIFGIVGCSLSILCFGAVLGLPFGITAVVLGILGLRRVRRGEAHNQSQALTAVILGSVAILVSTAIITLLVIGDFEGWFPDDDLITSDAGYTLAGGDVATYEDGLKATVSEAREVTGPSDVPSGATAVEFTVTLENTADTGKDIDSDISAFVDDADDYLDTVPGADLPSSLAAGESARVDVTVIVPETTDDTLDVEFYPAWEYEYTDWELDLPAATA